MTCVNTKLGMLEARASTDKEYPGIIVGLNRNGKWMEFAWVEVDETEDKPVLKIHAYDANIENDDPIFDVDIEEKEINKYWESDPWIMS